MFNNKMQGINFVQIKCFDVIKKLSKHIYLKWSCILNLKLWAKNYDENKNQGSKFPRVILNIYFEYQPKYQKWHLVNIIGNDIWFDI
jgi:hypothetical protein